MELIPTMAEAEAAVEVGEAERPWKEVAPGIVEVQWFHPQTGQLLFAVAYDVKTGEVAGIYEA